jgi:hypothetical protein
MADMEELFLHAYTSIADLRRDTPDIAEMGLLLDTIWLIDGRVALITSIDYEEGSVTPLVRRFWAWREPMKLIVPEYRDGMPHETQNLVVGRNGTPG